jgi:hypothetical protein
MRTPRHLVPMRFKEDDLRAFLDAAKKIGKVTRMDSRDTAKRSLRQRRAYHSFCCSRNSMHRYNYLVKRPVFMEE